MTDKDPRFSLPAIPRNPGQLTPARQLALAGQECWAAVDVMRWLRDVAHGQDPNLYHYPDGTAAPQEPIPWQHRVAAAKMFLERAYGAPLQEVEVSGQVNHAHAHVMIDGRAPDDELAGLGIAQLEALERLELERLALVEGRTLAPAAVTVEHVAPIRAPDLVDVPAVEVAEPAPEAAPAEGETREEFVARAVAPRLRLGASVL